MRLFSLFLSCLLIQDAASGFQTGPVFQVHLIGSETSAVVNSRQTLGFTVEVTSANGEPVSDAAVALRLPDSDATGAFADGTHAVVSYTDAAGHAQFPVIHWGAIPGPASLRITAAKGDLHAGLLIEETLSLTLALKPPTPPPIQPATPVPAKPVAAVAPPIKPLATLTASKSGATPAPPIALAKQPVISITNAPSGHSHANKKWLIVAAVAAAAGVGAALAFKGKGGAGSGAPSSSLTIGTPAVNVNPPPAP